MATRRNERHNYFSQDATAFTSRNLHSLTSIMVKIDLWDMESISSIKVLISADKDT